MRKSRKVIVVANWKLNPATIGNARRLFLDIRERIGKVTGSVDVRIAPPAPFLLELNSLSPTGNITLAAQDASTEREGAYTGEISASMLKSAGARSVIVGHSERRARGETDAIIAQKIAEITRQKLQAVVCVGEARRDTHGHYFGTIESQLRAALKELPREAASRLIIAYEPVWAISTSGTGNDAAAEDVYEMKLFIKKILTDLFGRAAAAKIRILYGGSVTPKNAAQLLDEGCVDGLLVGGSSLRARDFSLIVHEAKLYAKRSPS